MTNEELLIHFERWKTKKDPEAFQQLYQHFEPAIQATVYKWNNNFEPGTLETIGKVQLVKAFESYDPKKNTSLNTHVYNYLQKMSRYVFNYGEAVRMPENLRLKMGSFIAAFEHLRDQLGRDPTVDELADELAWSRKNVQKMLDYYYSENMESKINFVPVDYYDSKDAVIESVYQTLSPEEKLVFEHLTGYGGKPILSAKEIAKKLKTSPASVTRIRDKLLEKFM